MNGIDFYLDIHNGRLSELLPIVAVETEEDVIRYAKEGYDTHPLSVFKKCFPNVGVEYIYYQKSVVTDLIYYDSDVLFTLYTFVNGDGFQYLEIDRKNLGERIKHFKQRMIKALKMGDWFNYYRDVPDAYAIEFVVRTLHLLPEDKRYDGFIHQYRKRDYGFQHLTVEFMEEIVRLKGLGNHLVNTNHLIHVYRGFGLNGNKDGYSYTTKQDVAEFYATRIDGKGYLLEGDILEADVIEFIDKDEILALPNKVINKKVVLFD